MHATDRRCVVVVGVVLFAALHAKQVYGSPLGETARGLGEGEWVQLGTYADLMDATADEDFYRTFEYSFRMYWVRTGALGTGKLVHLGSGHTSGEWHLVEYDEASDSWSRNSAADLGCHIHSYDQFAVDVATGESYALCLDNSFSRWDGGAWNPLSAWPGGYATLMATAHFPETGAIWAANGFGDNDQLFSYDLASDEWSARGNYPLGENLDMVYSPIHERVVFSGGDDNTSIYLIDATGTVTTSTVTTPTNWRVKKALADYDPVTGDILLFFSDDDAIRRYDPVDDQLTDVGTFADYPPFSMADGEEAWGKGVVIATIPDYGVIAIADDTTGAVWLYRRTAGPPPGSDESSSGGSDVESSGSSGDEGSSSRGDGDADTSTSGENDDDGAADSSSDAAQDDDENAEGCGCRANDTEANAMFLVVIAFANRSRRRCKRSTRP